MVPLASLLAYVDNDFTFVEDPANPLDAAQGTFAKTGPKQITFTPTP